MLSTILGAYSLSLADPPGTSAIVGAVDWLEGTLLGTVATTIAVIAVAGVGFATLSGHFSVRRAQTTIVGCFILFGASSIATGIQGAIRNGETDQELPLFTVAEPSPLKELPRRAVDYDPYAGAAVPAR